MWMERQMVIRKTTCNSVYTDTRKYNLPHVQPLLLEMLIRDHPHLVYQ
jgi:hypothetical protein